MDPTATLRFIQDELDDIEGTNDESEEVDYLVDCLREWLAKGGFQPQWDAYPKATEYYNGRVETITRQAREEMLS